MDLLSHERFNNLAKKKRSAFRRKESLSIDAAVHSNEFHSYRNRYPFFGHIEVLIDHCSPFLMYSSNDDLVAQVYFWYGSNSYERQSIKEWVNRSKSCTTVFDVGAYTGVFGLASYNSSNSVSVHAFEPTRRVYSRLISNMQLNKVSSRMLSVNNAVAETEREVNFLQYRKEHVLGAGASFIDKKIPIFDDQEKVKTITLDAYSELKKVKPELVKIDVEEAEALVLSGMSGVLDQHRPDLIVEVTPETVTEVTTYLSKHAYKFYMLDDARSATRLISDPQLELNQLKTNSTRDRVACNILAER